MLRADLEEGWLSYLNAGARGRRRDALRLLDTFIDNLLEEEPQVWEAWAIQLVTATADDGMDIPVHFPLLHRVLYPLLRAGVERHEPHYARWLAHFASSLHRLTPGGLPPELGSRVGLLREAVRLNPQDQLARRQLVAEEATYLRYTLHELPSGVLYGMNGATPEQCDELSDHLSDFRQLLQTDEEDRKYAQLIEECQFHYTTYRDYLKIRQSDMSYRQYIESLA
ncbi:hypothetical protein [Deinococcus sp.]|uniref:hypothetical protein n=1 Tax=Deinococcus sp. TaxID=47478 RepID=UPI003C79AC2F